MQTLQQKPIQELMKLSLDQVVALGLPLEHFLKEGRVEIGPELAAYILETCWYSGQRKVRPDHVETVAELMVKEHWNAGHQVAFGLLEDKLHLVNGYHRLHAIVNTGLNQVFQNLIVEVKDGLELAQLYASFDTTQKGRSTGDILSAMGVREVTGVPAMLSRGVLLAIPFIQSGLATPKHKMALPIKLESAEDWWEEAREFSSLFKGGDKVIRDAFRSGGYLAVILVTMKYQPEKAKEFWGGILRNDGLRKRTPQHAIVRTIFAGKRGSGSSGALHNMKVAASGWNAFFEGRELSFMQPSRTVGPIHLQGTPFKRGTND